MSLKYGMFTNIRGQRVEFATELIVPQDRHYHREAKSQKSQLESEHKHGTSKDIKTPIEKKMT